MGEIPNNLYSEKFKNNNGPTRHTISEIEADKYERAQNEKEKAKNNYKKRGTGKFIKHGTRARLKGIPFYIPESIISEGDKISYHYGYYERGNTSLHILIENGCCDIDGVKITKEQFKKYLRRIAVNDGMNHNIEFKNLPIEAKYNDIYVEGYLSIKDERTRKLIAEGSLDRMNAVPYDAQKYEIPEEQNLYREGFFEHGNRELLRNLSNLTDYELNNIGYNDYVSGIDKEELPEEIKTNSSYLAGNMYASIVNLKSKHK